MNEKIKHENESIVYIIIDLFFTFAPIVYLIFMRVITNAWENILKRSDISFISMILFGQTFIKFLKALLKNKNKKILHIILLLVVVILFIGLIPPIIFLTLIEIKQGNQVIYILQTIWLVLGTAVYFIIGAASYIIEEHTITNSDFIKEKWNIGNIETEK